jgi:hypothetical protein
VKRCPRQMAGLAQFSGRLERTVRRILLPQASGRALADFFSREALSHNRKDMNLEISMPELERRVQEGIQSGRLHVDELLPKALDALSEKEAAGAQSGAAIVDVMQSSPYKEIDLEPRRDHLPVRDASL